MSQLNLPHGTGDQKKCKTGKLKSENGYANKLGLVLGLALEWL